MVCQDFYRCFLFFALCIFCQLNEILLQNPPPVDPAATLYYKESAEADFGVRMTFDKTKDKRLNVIIYYDTLTQSATDFFKSQITAQLIDSLTACQVINWNFSPCSTTKLAQGGTLSCPKGADQCRFDQVHGCLDTAFNWHQDTMGKFVVCTNTAGKTTDQCNQELGGLISSDMQECVRSARGAASCNASYGNFQNARATKNDENTAKLPNAFTNFKGAVCAVLGQANLQCTAVCT